MADLKISGSGREFGGTYDRVIISGSGVVEGDVEAMEVRFSGTGTVNGNTKARDVKISGSGTFQGDVTTDRLTISGSGRVGGDLYGAIVKTSGSAHFDKNVKADDLHVSGTCVINQKLEAKQVRASGMLRVHGDVVAESFESHGGFRVGSIQAEEIILKTGGKSRAKHLKGGKVVCRGPRHRLVRTLWNALLTPLNIHFIRLEAETVEGQSVHLEYTEADVVRGERVVIGKRSRVRVVEYSESLDIEPGGFVKEKRRIEK